MNGPFSGSRLANLRQKRPTQFENVVVPKQQQKPLSLQLDEQPSYQPSMAVMGGRTATRFLKGRIERTSGSQKPQAEETVGQGFAISKENNFQMERKPTLKLSQPQDGNFKLVLNDSPQFDKKRADIKIAPQQPVQKRILIQKKQQQPKLQIKPEAKQEVKQEVKPAVKQVNKVEEQAINVSTKNQQARIQQAQIQESKDGLENENELVECPEGCGRKFNRKALEKHAKACKLVFMSKRKQFNSEAKRLTSHQQAAIIKQNKLQQKKGQMAMTKGKGFQKTGQNWKAASEDFRSAVKAIKKQGAQNEGQEGEQKQEMVKSTCEYCEKQFAEVLLAKHLENCVKKKEKDLKEKKKTSKKK